MTTFGGWLDDYAGEDNLVAGVARLWRSAKSEQDARPRVSAVQSITEWLAEHRGVADESLRAAVRAFNEARGGRQATEAEVGAFRAMNSPGTIAPVPGDHEQPAGPSPAVMAVLGRIESMLAQVQEQNLELLAWTKLQDERIKPITDLLGELADAESAPEPDPAYLDELAHQSAEEAQADADPDGPGQPWQHGPDGLWGNIMAPEPDPERMAQLGDPRLVEEEP